MTVVFVKLPEMPKATVRLQKFLANPAKKEKMPIFMSAACFSKLTGLARRCQALTG